MRIDRLGLFEIRPGLFIAGIEAQGLAEAANRPIDVPHFERRRPEILNRGDVTRLQSHGLGIVVYGALQIVLGDEQVRQLEVHSARWASLLQKPLRCRIASAVFPCRTSAIVMSFCASVKSRI